MRAAASTRLLSTREEFGRTLVRLGMLSRDVVVLDGDLSGSTCTRLFAERFPERFYNMGISEQDLIGTAAGLSMAGKIAFAASFAIFITGRCWEQIRQSVALPGCNVNIVGTHGGITVGKDGASHQAMEDVAVMRAIPSMTVIVPADAVATRKAVEAAAWYEGPIYLRLTREKLPIVYTEEQRFMVGRGVELLPGSDVTLFGMGVMVHTALQAARLLSQEGISAQVVDPITVKPLDEDLVCRAAARTGCVVTAEEHSIIGGLGDAVAEVLGRCCPVPMERVGARDSFGRSGDPTDLLDYFDLTPQQVARAARRALQRRDQGLHLRPPRAAPSVQASPEPALPDPPRVQAGEVPTSSDGPRPLEAERCTTMEFPMRDLMLFVGSSNPQLGHDVAKALGRPMGAADVNRFSDGEVYVCFNESVRDQDVFLIQSTSYPGNDHLMELLLMIDACRRASATRINAVMPYMGYCRQDRQNKPRVPISAKVVANMLTSVGVDRIITIDIHAHQIQGFFDVPVDHLHTAPLLIKALRGLDIVEPVVVSPDAGGVELASQFAMGLGGSMALIDRRRGAPAKVKTMHLVGEVDGRDCILVDDMVDTAGTLTEAADLLISSGARSVRAASTHPVLSGPALERLNRSKISELFVTDTIVLPAEKQVEKIRVVSVAPLLAAAIHNVHTGESVSQLSHG